MEGYLTEPGAEKDNTDEFPVLSEKAILDMQRAAKEPGTTAAKSVAGTLRSLLAALGRAEKRWVALESKLEAQGRVLAEIKHTNGLNGKIASANGSPVAKPRAGPTTEAPREQLLERIASLENYIAGRSDRWQEIEAELRTKIARIGELEGELADRTERERELERRLATAGSRSDDLQNQLQVLSMKLASSRVPDESSAPRRVVGLGPQLRLASSAGTLESLSDETGSHPDSPVALLCISSGHGDSYAIDKSPFTIGRSRDNDIRVESESVSRRHAIIRRDEIGTFIEDQSSTNGIYVNGERIECVQLQPGDEISIGGTRFRFLVGAPT